jgi:2-dehydropantoate 2-reductase
LRVVIFGTGGVGGYFGARLASVGEDVVFIARGEHLTAIRTQGLRVDSVMGDILTQPPVWPTLSRLASIRSGQKKRA